MSSNGTCAVALPTLPMTSKRRGLTTSELADLKEGLSKQGYNYIGLSVTPITEGLPYRTWQSKKKRYSTLLRLLTP